MGVLIMEDRKYQRAKQRMEDEKSFYNHLIAYLVINAFLLVVNVLSTPGNWWFYWITLFWGIGVAVHGISTFSRRGIFSKEWEERKIRQYMEEDE